MLGFLRLFYLIQGVPDDLDVHLIKILRYKSLKLTLADIIHLLIDARLKEGCEGGVHQHRIVQLSRSAGKKWNLWDQSLYVIEEGKSLRGSLSKLT